MSTVLAIDQGTSATKAAVVGSDDRLLGLAEVEVRPRYLDLGGVEVDPQQLWESVLMAGRTAVQRAGVAVDVVSLANQGETVLAWDRTTAEPLSNLIVWQDRRAESITAQLGVHRDLLAARTGLTLDPYFSAPKQAWLRRNVTRQGVVTTSDAWLLHRLTGEFVTDASTASRSLLTDLNGIDWDGELLELFGLADEQHPTIVPSDAVVGTTTAFGGRIPVGGLIVDQPAALLAQRCLSQGDAKCTFGTGAFLLANAGTIPARSFAGLTASAAWRARGSTTYCFDGQVYTAASAVRWLQQLGLIRHASDIDRVSATDAGGVISVPALAGLAAPWWRSDARACLLGMTLSTGPEHIVFAVLQGIAAQVAELARLVETDTGRVLDRLPVDGGLTRSRVLMQAVADQLQTHLAVYPTLHATLLGAAALGRAAVDDSLSLDEAIVGWKPSRTYHPRWSADRAADFRARWNAALTAAC